MDDHDQPSELEQYSQFYIEEQYSEFYIEYVPRLVAFLIYQSLSLADARVWVGSVTFELRYADGRERTQIVRDQLVHADALAPRYDGKAI